MESNNVEIIQPKSIMEFYAGENVWEVFQPIRRGGPNILRTAKEKVGELLSRGHKMGDATSDYLPVYWTCAQWASASRDSEVPHQPAEKADLAHMPMQVTFYSFQNGASFNIL
jgi:hypothetical protein